jgi:small conductance mechanosensitive channel
MNLEIIYKLLLDYGLPVFKAILLYLVGAFLIKKLLLITRKIMEKRAYEITLQKFLLNLIRWVLIVFLLVSVVGTLGIETTSFAAALASVGLAVGLALQGSLSNFAGGVLILIFKHFKVGDTIEAQGIMGTVKEIDILNTKLITPQNKLAIIPNGSLANGNIINFTSEGTLRVDTTIGVGYESDIAETMAALLAMVHAHPKVLKEPEPMIVVAANSASSIDIHVRPYTLTEDHWDVFWYIQKNFKPTLDAIGVEIPYPHQVEIKKGR